MARGEDLLPSLADIVEGSSSLDKERFHFVMRADGRCCVDG